MTILAFWAVRWRPRRIWRRSSYKTLKAYALPLVGANAVNYWGRNLDNLLVGSFLGPAVLAFYARAYQLMLAPVMQITLALGRVLQASFASDIARQRNVEIRYTVAQGDVAYAGFLMAAVLVPVAEPFVQVFFGSNWKPMGPLLAIFASSIGFQVVISANGALLRAAGETRLLFRLGLYNSGLLMAAMACAIPCGARCVAATFSVESLLGCAIVIIPVCRKFDFAWLPVVRVMFKATWLPLGVLMILSGCLLFMSKHGALMEFGCEMACLVLLAPVLAWEARRRARRFGVLA
jgi:O-antigen/teichoic acid export membrane protein